MILRPSLIGSTATSTTNSAGYFASAVHFDGSTEFENTNVTAGNSSLFSFAMWVKLGTGFLDGGYNIFSLTHPTAGQVFYIYGNSDGSGRFSGGADTSGNFLFFNFAAGSIVENVWMLLMGGSSTNLSAGNKIIQLYKDDTAISGSKVDSSPAFETPFSGSDLSIPDSVLAAYSGTLDVANALFMPGLLVDFSILENRRLFVDAEGKPVDPAIATAALGTPAILFSGDSTTFSTNQGTGGAFVLTGSLTNASTSPSD